MNTVDHLRNPAFSSFLDLARWTAAWLVFVGHLRNPLFFGFSDIGASASNPLVVGWYFVTGWFGEAVIVFFVLSGFLIGGISIAKYTQKAFQPSHYAVDRFTRLYVAFIPALLLTLVLDMVGVHYFSAAGLYDGTQAMFADKLAAPYAIDKHSQAVFWGNVVMLQTFQVDAFGSNSPLWTISAEFWFYVAFGIALAILMRTPNVVARVLLMALSAAVLIALLTPIFAYYLGLWTIGLAVAFMPANRFRWPIAFAIILLGLLVVIRVKSGALMGFEYGQAIRDYSVALAFGLLLHSMRETKSTLLERTAAFNKWIADFSFSLYLIHFPIMVFTLSALYATGEFPKILSGYAPSDPEGLGLYAGIVIFMAVAAWVFAQVTEKQTWRVRETAKRWLNV